MYMAHYETDDRGTDGWRKNYKVLHAHILQIDHPTEQTRHASQLCHQNREYRRPHLNKFEIIFNGRETPFQLWLIGSLPRSHRRHCESCDRMGAIAANETSASCRVRAIHIRRPKSLGLLHSPTDFCIKAKATCPFSIFF